MIINLKQLAKLRILSYIYFAEKDLSIDTLERELGIRRNFVDRILKEYILKGYVIENSPNRFATTEKGDNLTLYDFLDVSNFLYELEYLFVKKTTFDSVIEDGLKKIIEAIIFEASKTTLTKLKNQFEELEADMFYL
jgi:hypothetical protein